MYFCADKNLYFFFFFPFFRSLESALAALNSTLVDLKLRFDTLDKVMSCGEGKTLSSAYSTTTSTQDYIVYGLEKSFFCTTNKVSDATTSIPFNTLLALGATVAAAVVML